jgi:hypothetical protein
MISNFSELGGQSKPVEFPRQDAQVSNDFSWERRIILAVAHFREGCHPQRPRERLKGAKGCLVL